ncbi:MAG: hypothetical protein ABIH41_02795, partial [Nanoarchaeota archaeon]
VQVQNKVKNIVVGHRANYVRELRRFIEANRFYKGDIHSFLVDLQSLRTGLDDLGTKTAKSYSASQHLFYDHTDPIYKTLGEMHTLLKRLDAAVEKTKASHIPELLKLVSERSRRKQESADHRAALAALTKRKNELASQIEEAQKALGSLETGEEYVQMQVTQKRIGALNTQIERNADLIRVLFAAMGRAMRKYEKISLDSARLSAYLEDAARALEGDPELHIISTLNKMRSAVENGSVKVDNAEKNIRAIDTALDGRLPTLAEDRRLLFKELHDAKDRLSQSTAGARGIEKRTELGQLKTEAAALDKETAARRGLAEGADIGSVETRIIEEALSVFAVELAISHAKKPDGRRRQTKNI